jgi:hypothetical protein
MNIPAFRDPSQYGIECADSYDGAYSQLVFHHRRKSF